MSSLATWKWGKQCNLRQGSSFRARETQREVENCLLEDTLSLHSSVHVTLMRACS